MQTTFLIGNGFDVNLGLKTRYQDFYDYYLGLDTSSDSENVKKFKKHLKENRNKFWSDFEFALGRYTTEFETFAQLEEVYDDINDEMQKYISKINELPLPLNVSSSVLKEKLASPETFLSPAEKNRINIMHKRITTSDNIINIINFNYTTTIERLLDYENDSLIIGSTSYSQIYDTVINSVLHVHGSVEDPILGVDAVMQISNEQLVQSGEVAGYLVKPSINATLGSMYDDRAKDAIMKSHLICIYGMSLGETDATWWKLVGKRLRDDTIVVLYVYDNNGKNISARKKSQYNKKWRDRFFEVAEIPDVERADLEKKLFVALNTKIFDICI